MSSPSSPAHPLALLRTLGAALCAASLAACPENPPADAGDARTDAPADAPDASDAPAPPVDVPDVPPVPRCGPDAVPYPTNQGACAVENPVPDGGPPPPGRCAASATPAGELRANELEGTDSVVTVSGRRVQRAANRLPLSGFPMSTLRIPGTRFVVVNDSGLLTAHLWVVDTAATPMRVVPGGEQSFPRDSTDREPGLFYGMAYDPTTRVLYAAGAGGNRVYAFDVSAEGALSPNPGRTIDLGFANAGDGLDPMGRPRSGFVSGIELSSDGSQLYISLMRGFALQVYNTMTRALVRTIPFERGPDMEAPYPYVVARRPGDDRRVYVSLWGTRRVAEVDVAMGAVTRTFDVRKNPSELLFSPDGARLYVAASDSDAIDVIDLAMPSAPIRTHYLAAGGAMALRGISPAALAWGPANTLYVAEPDANAIEVLDGTTLASLGMIPTEHWPTDVDVAPDGTVVVTAGKGIGMGPNNTPGSTDITQLMRGSFARYAAPDAAALAAGRTVVARNNTVMRDFNTVTCPAGAPYDFPVPPIGSTQGSRQIRHVIMVVRENKTYDAVLGDYEGSPPANPANGDPTLTLFPRAEMPQVYPNARALVRRFTSLDNYYSNAEQSLQGHVRTVLGRSTDFNERTWLHSWGRATLLPAQAFPGAGLPEEGSAFNAMERAGIRVQEWGETVGAASDAQNMAGRYPGAVYNYGAPDIRKARALADWIQGTNNVGMNRASACDLPQFLYFILPNDHTEGGRANRPTPRSHIQDNDEGTGFIVDALSHSRFWPETLLVVVEDDPQDGGDHVDNHRSIAFMVSPWVRRGYTSHVHADESSLYHTIELILGMAPHNQIVADAAPLYDAFTSTPDFTPYRYIPRRECEALNPASGMYAEESARWDFSMPDNQPGLSRLVWRMTHNGQEPPWRAPAAGAEREDGDDDDD